MMLLVYGLEKFAARPELSPQQQQIGDELRQMIELLREAKGGGVAQEFAGKLKFLDDNRDAIEKGIVAWINLIEVIVQGAERRYPTGHGRHKKEQVKAALHQIITSDDFEFPQVPAYLQPVIMDIAVDYSVEILVANLNEYHLWDSSRPDQPSWRGAMRGALAIVMTLLTPAAEILSWLYVRLKYWEPLTPELAAAVEKVKAANLLKIKRELLGGPTDLVVFVANHGPQMIAGFKLFFEVVHLAERFIEKSGPEKKAYARDLIIAVLDELGFPLPAGLFGALVTGFIDAGIESAWSVFDLRAPETFKHRRQANAAA
jgi:hypothetical protein